MNDIAKHPCFNKDVRHVHGRIHLPVAPRCNMQCNFCNRKYDCVNESHPGVTSAVLTPHQALDYLREALISRPEITVVGLAGPGDPFANPDETMETLRLVRREFPHMLLCVATNGLAAGPYIEEMAALRVQHVTLTVNAIDPAIGEKIYAWIRYGKRSLLGRAAAATLLQRQMETLHNLKKSGITVKINTIIIPGINDRHALEIANAAADLGVDLMNCMPMAQVKGAAFEGIPEPEEAMMESIRASCGTLLPQMSHCSRCRADAAGLLSEPAATEQLLRIRDFAEADRHSITERPFVAVASYEGALVNRHLGEADHFLIFRQNPNNAGVFEMRENRPAPPAGDGDQRWISLANALADCRAVLVKAAGPNPIKVLTTHGLKVIEMEGFIDEALRAIYSNRSIPNSMKRSFAGCSQGISCRGAGTGCG
jgi:nitrogen fixation protein NifB